VAYDVCQPGETDFKALSRRFYGSEKYAIALQAYNRDHSQNGATLFGPTPILQPGQQVLKPPASMLERDFKIVEPSPIVPTANGGSPLGLPSALTQTAVPTIPAQGPVGVASAPTADAPRTYKVLDPQGERIMDIAQRVLGNRNSWPDIYRLNPTHDPRNPIPYGAELRLPTK
jgi:hypothetical protein